MCAAREDATGCERRGAVQSLLRGGGGKRRGGFLQVAVDDGDREFVSEFLACPNHDLKIAGEPVLHALVLRG